MAGIDVNGDRWRLYHDGNHRHPRWANEYSLRMHAWEIRLDMRPDLTDPATIGCLAATARKAWGDDHLCCIPPMPGVSDLWRACSARVLKTGFRVSCSGETEGKAWETAILAAPPPEVGDAT